MSFTSNHDENTWNGTEFERMGPAAKTFAALCYMMPGMPLIYNGQEVAFNRRLEFFKKDSIAWKGDASYTTFYKKLNQLRKANKALWSGDNRNVSYKVDPKGNTLIIERTKEQNRVVALFNMSGKEVQMATPSSAKKEYLSGKTYKPNTKVTLKPWEFLIFVK